MVHRPRLIGAMRFASVGFRFMYEGILYLCSTEDIMSMLPAVCRIMAEHCLTLFSFNSRYHLRKPLGPFTLAMSELYLGHSLFCDRTKSKTLNSAL